MGVFLEMKAWLKHLFPLWKCIEKMSSIKKRTRYHQNVSVKLHFSKICTIPTIIYTHVQSSSNDDLNSIYFIQRWFSALNFINRTRGEPWGWSIYETKPYLYYFQKPQWLQFHTMILLSGEGKMQGCKHVCQYIVKQFMVTDTTFSVNFFWT